MRHMLNIQDCATIGKNLSGGFFCLFFSKISCYQPGVWTPVLTIAHSLEYQNVAVPHMQLLSSLVMQTRACLQHTPVSHLNAFPLWCKTKKKLLLSGFSFDFLGMTTKTKQKTKKASSYHWIGTQPIRESMTQAKQDCQWRPERRAVESGHLLNTVKKYIISHSAGILVVLSDGSLVLLHGELWVHSSPCNMMQ